MTTDAAAQAAEPPRSFWSRWMGVYFSPGETFEDVGRRPNILPPLILSLTSGLALTEAILFKIGMDRIVRNAIAQSGQAGQMTPEQIDDAVRGAATVGTIIAHAIPLLGTPIFLLIVAGLGLAFVNGFYGGKLDFKRSFSVACYANLINVVGVLMAMFIVFFGDPEQFNSNNPMPTNPGFFLNPLEISKPVLMIATSLDLLSFWLIAVLGVGYSAATGGKVKAFSISALFFACWLVLVLLRVGLALIS